MSKKRNGIRSVDGQRDRRSAGGPDMSGETDFDPQGEDGSLDFSASEGTQLRPIKGGKRSIRDTKMWKDTGGVLSRLWGNYVTALKVAFNRMDRRGQEELIMRMSQIVTVGAAVVTTYVWYWFMPQQIRVIVLPLVLIGSWWLGTRVVAPAMISRFEDYLNPPYD